MPTIEEDFTDTAGFPPIVDVGAVRRHLGLTKEQLGRLLEVDVSTISKMEAPRGTPWRRDPAVRMERLLNAYLAGWRPDDWPSGEPRP